MAFLPLTVSAVWWNPLTWGEQTLTFSGAGDKSFTPTLLPLSDSSWDIGTSTNAYRTGFFDELCLTADSCKTAWPTGSGSSYFGLLNDVSTSSDATGDIYYLNSSGQITNLNAGSDGQVLKLSSGIPSWGTDNTGAGGGDFAWTVNTGYNSTSTTLGFLNGFFSTASSTLSGNVYLPALSQGFTGVGSNGLVYTFATSSINTSELNNDAGFLATVDISDDTNLAVNWPITLTGDTLGFSGLSTTTDSGLSQGIAYIGSGGLLQTTASSTFSLSDFTNDLATLTATDGTLTFSGSYNGATARTVGLNLGNANTWTALQTFSYASSTGISSSYASSTNGFFGTLNLPNLSDGCLNITSGLVGSTGSSCGGGVDGYDFDYGQSLDYGITGASTSTPIEFTAGIQASTTSYFDNSTSTLLTVLNNFYAPSGFAGTGLTISGTAINCDTADTNTFGCLSDTDWDTFNGKQNAISFGTGVETALGVNIGSAGAPVLFNGAGGTPSSLTLTNATGLPISTGVSGLGSNVATFLGTPTEANLYSALSDVTQFWEAGDTINSGTLALASLTLTGTIPHENGGLEADVSAYDGFPHISGGVTTSTTSPVFFERSFTNWASTTPNSNSSIYASGATSTLSLYLPRSVSFSAIGGAIRTGTSLLCEIGNGTSSTTRLLTTTVAETSDSTTLAGYVTVACGSGSGDPDDASFTIIGEYSR